MESQENSNKSLKTALVVLIITSLLLVGYIVYEKISTVNNQASGSKDNTNEENTIPAPATFSSVKESGTLQASGYIEKVSKAKTNDVGAGDEGTVDYIYFHIVESNSGEIYTYINNHAGNSFFSTNAIGIGCLENNKIHYWNVSDEYGDKNYELSVEDTAKIMNSTSTNPVKLELTRMPYSSAKGATTCTSMMTTIKVIG